MSDHTQPTDAQIEEANSETRYIAYSVYASAGELGDADRGELAEELLTGLEPLKEQGLVVRGIYDVSALRADADVMFWYHAPTIELVQAAYSVIRRSLLGGVLEPIWSVVGIHRPAEFNKGHLPALLVDEVPGDYICVYPFVRSYDWYVLDPAERSKMLRDHGMAAASYKDVKANTIASFALGDYEWLLAFEAPELHRIVDLMRDLRNTEARLHVREEIPFYTGPRRELVDIISDWR
ncbi:MULTISPECIES: hydrogen peroxide-dependent heme synthase [unclassified Brevibacterium]|jgi:peroxiredoxin|uniref:hydrogen peroxide-dependent heme synthase n=1 Tax=unclassified Brevibacterium TaxID=2614124 RepID=UPI0010802F02|nr:hydrogen peroxide-dependent heme synthase [Brevibacterium sp. S111]TGD09858.1 chlorite dismutase [Brevibacterium sp. S111]